MSNRVTQGCWAINLLGQSAFSSCCSKTGLFGGQGKEVEQFQRQQSWHVQPGDCRLELHSAQQVMHHHMQCFVSNGPCMAGAGLKGYVMPSWVHDMLRRQAKQRQPDPVLKNKRQQIRDSSNKPLGMIMTTRQSKYRVPRDRTCVTLLLPSRAAYAHA